MRLAIPSDPAAASVGSPAVARSPISGWLPAVLLGLMTIALFWPATRCNFVSIDDGDFVTTNHQVQAGLSWAGVKWAFLNTKQAGTWAPLMWLSNMLACQLFGLAPWGHHLINVLLHAASTALVFLVFRRMTGAPWRSLLLAAFFGWHPLRVESVAWVAERKDTLSTFFWMLTLWMYVRYVEELKINRPKGRMYYGMTLVCFACGLMSKPMLVTLPCVLLLLDYWPMHRGQRGEGRGEKEGAVQLSPHPSHLSLYRRLVLDKIPFFVLAAAVSAITVVAQKQSGAVTALGNVAFAQRGANALVSYCRYLGKTFWPSKLAVLYPYPDHWPLGQVLLAGGTLLAISALFFAWRRRYPFLLMGWLWYLGTLIPVIGLAQVGTQAMANRYTYVPSIGLLIVIIWGAYELAGRRRYPAIGLSLASSAALVLCLAVTRRELVYWHDGVSLFERELEVTGSGHIAHKILGDGAYQQGRMDEAIQQYEEAIRLKPDYADAHVSLGLALTHKDRIDDATAQFQEAIRLEPGNAEAHNYLGSALYNQGRRDEGINQLQEALRLKPDDAEVRANLARALEQTNAPAAK